MKRKFLGLFVLVLAAIASQNADAVLLEFEDLPLNHTYNVGDSFFTSSVDVQVVSFQPLSGPPLSGTAFVDNLGMAGSTGQELSLKDAGLKFILNMQGDERGMWILFNDLGGGVNLGINDDVRTGTNLAAFSGTTIGGAMVTTVSSGSKGVILFVTGGDVESFTIGGHDLYVDRMFACCKPVPEPATIMLLGLGGVSVLLRRKKA